MIGNALEVVECVEVLHGEGPEDLRELCLELAGWMLHLGGASKTVAEGKQQSAELISSGKALEKFRQMVELQGGDVARHRRLQARCRKHSTQCKSPARKPDIVASMQCEQIGTACVILGGGRETQGRFRRSRRSASSCTKKLETAVAAGEPLATIHYNSEAKAARARQLIEASCEIGNAAPAKRPLIHQHHRQSRRVS